MIKLTIITAAALLGAASAASAATVVFSSSTGTWSNAVLQSAGPPFVTYTGNGTAVAQARWGVPASSAGKSGYNFTALAVDPVVVTPGAGSGVFAVAGFAHVNEPIGAPSITSIDLTFTTDITVDGTDLGRKSFIYNFEHDETPNNLNPCPYGGADNQGININGCADRVTFNYNTASDTFKIGNDVFTLKLDGFLLPGATAPVGAFLTTESAINNAELVGQIALRSTVPEPAAWALMLAGFSLVGGALRRRPALVA